jgi:hypothetical protein
MTGLWNGRLTSSLHNIIEVAKGGFLITLDHFEHSICTACHIRIVNGLLCDLREGYTLRVARADICLSSMDAIAVEIAWTGRDHWGR